MSILDCGTRCLSHGHLIPRDGTDESSPGDGTKPDDRQLDDALRLGSSDRGPGSPEIRRNIDGASSTFLLEIEHNTVDYGRPNRLGQPVPRGTSYCRSLCPELDNARHLVRAPSWRVPCIVRGVEVAKVRSILVHRRGHLVLCFRHRRRKDALYRISRDDDRVCELLDLRSPSTPACPRSTRRPRFQGSGFHGRSDRTCRVWNHRPPDPRERHYGRVAGPGLWRLRVCLRHSRPRHGPLGNCALSLRVPGGLAIAPSLSAWP